ncbi:sirohydrochlorin chelatase [Marinibactrum halimedae]|uniref:Cobalamin biosynthesis protein CbiX n=1 Tax=Marinibactrum halimedae TaxID=1444977 RepID=A0AA37TBC4_9GAMM|nr:CbiX/SirB N-terminal domain-containing protein [Marinibactrum halimedae]MCD9459855.1 CbiX/SirB N-terminal domain-containing protein [Marinibactrum halimedae]GLS26950.1 hypothetical protein GCM10007877_26690 [Marinibactrum halimedae]
MIRDNENNAPKALLLMAHGSRAEVANNEFLATVEKVKIVTPGYDYIGGIFLELSAPLLVDESAKLYEKGFRSIDLYPVFFNQGRHVSRDIPNQIEKAVKACDGLTIQLLPYFGSNDELPTLISQHIQNSSRR